MLHRLITILWSIVALSLINVPQAISANSKEVNRPKIGLALSGGGARGAAHVGVIKTLQELHIPIDYIAGTSMGAVIGGLYASGMSTEEIELQLQDIDWDGVFQDKPSRPDRSMRRKDDDKDYLVKGRLGINDDGINIPNALVQGQKFDLILRSLTMPVNHIRDFDQLPIPFRAVAMDIASGDEVVLSEGDLTRAIRASMAIPAIFAAVEWDGKLLVDGGSANNLPVSVVRDMGADIVIAVDISTPLQEQKKLGRIFGIVQQLTALLTRRNVENQIATLTDSDMLIIPDLGTISTMDFDRVSEAVTAGREASSMMSSVLQPHTVSAAEYQQATTSSSLARAPVPQIEFLEFVNNSIIDDAVLAHNFGIKVGDEIQISEIETGINNIYGLDIFESVNYEILSRNGETGLVVRTNEKSWGTDWLQLGLNLSSDFSGESGYNITASATKQPLNSLNGEWRNTLKIGDQSSLITEIYQPLGVESKYFLSASAFFENKKLRTYSDSSQRAEAEYNISQWGGDLSLGRNISNWGELRFGINKSAGEAEVEIGSPSVKDIDFDDGYYFVSARVDTLDNLYFPRSGWLNSITWLSSSNFLGADSAYEQMELKFSSAMTWGKGTLLTKLNYGATISGQSPLHNRFRLGGFMKLSGFEADQLSGQYYGLASLAYQYEIHGKSLPTYAGLALQAGNAWEYRDDVDFNDVLGSATLFLGTDTRIGPIYLGYGISEGGKDAAYLFLGQPFF